MNEHEQIIELQAKLALVEVEAKMARAEAEQRIAMLERQLAAERGVQGHVEQARDEQLAAITEAHEQQLEQQREELELWRRGDHQGLRPLLAAQIEAIERSAEQLAGQQLSDAMRALLERKQGERRELLAALARLG